MKKVCHLSSVHEGLDVRIYVKECVSLASAGYDTHLIINGSVQDIERAAAQGVKLHVLPPQPTSRLSRMIKQGWRCFKIARQINADIYHFHDPELIPYGISLALANKQVIYDVHEDLPRDILSKEWLPSWLRCVVAKLAALIEYIGARYFFLVVTATPFIAKRFARINPKTIDINNFPIITELNSTLPWSEKRDEVCYLGGLSVIRGVRTLVTACGLLKTSTHLNLAGKFSDENLKEEVKTYPGWERVNELGYVDRSRVRNILGCSFAGLVTLHPTISYLDSLPIKMFEYMAAGIPVIASNFPLWREIVEGNDCGLCVDPMEPMAIAEAIDFLANHPERAKQMGKNGYKAVHQKYNWSNEERKLLGLYERLSNYHA